ncbi:uncharacterized protein LOC127751118 [Frankliniella occidentalis]|uniref:Uncharacterized protein LOC127751118 n=1 Tax=Frankliniella occidentalis TaxID=133901 RepID=A0A9C6XT90_FRAOC|nr:uncharacterized protein LOC127751118 [Frankliniella occidentalis]
MVGKTPRVRGRYTKYTRHYNKDWEKVPEFASWISETPQHLQDLGMPEAWCKLCSCPLRAHRDGLKDHLVTDKHKKNAAAVPTNRASTLTNYGFRVKTKESKERDLVLAAHVACHSSVRTIDHLGEIINCISSEGNRQPPLKLHRTKCSKIICKVISPCMQRDLVKDVGDCWCWFSLIIDESTDTTTMKHLAIMIKYYSHKHKCMILDFLGLVETPECTATILYNVIKEFLKKIGLNIKKILALGTDGAANLCGAHHSVFSLLKQNECPNLHLVKCVCHGLDKCASKASVAFPSSLGYLIRESRNWFSHSALRKVQYEREYKALTDGQKPPLLVKLATTRWLSWYGAVKSHLLQYSELRHLFRQAADADPEKKKCPMAHQLAALHEDGSHLLYLAFLKPILRELTSINTLFQSSAADIAGKSLVLRKLFQVNKIKNKNQIQN